MTVPNSYNHVPESEVALVQDHPYCGEHGLVLLVVDIMGKSITCELDGKGYL